MGEVIKGKCGVRISKGCETQMLGCRYRHMGFFRCGATVDTTLAQRGEAAAVQITDAMRVERF